MKIEKSFNFKTSKAAQGKGGKTTKKTLYIGTRYSPERNRKWGSIIKYNKKNYYLGSFIMEEHAAFAYDKKAIEFYGEDATRNFPHLSLEELTRKLENIKAENVVLFDNFPAKNRQGKLRNIPKTSIYIGVAYDRMSKKKWLSSINYKKKLFYIGNFETEEEAAQAYDKKALEIYGKNAKLNSPELKKILSKKRYPSDPEKRIVRILDKKSGVKNTIILLLKKDSPNQFDPAKSKSVQGKSGNKGYTHKTSYIGVRYDNGRLHPWYSSIKHNYKSYYLGSFAKDEYAALAYDKKALELYGHDATRNFPDLTKFKLNKKLREIAAEDSIIFYDHFSKKQQGTQRNFPDKSSKYVGVSFNKDNSKWKASIGYHKKRYHLGYYEKEKEAAFAYDTKALELYGETARLNFPENKRDKLKKNLADAQKTKKGK